MRASFTVFLVVATIAAAGCSQTTAPTSPSSVVGGTSASTLVSGASAEASGTMAKINGPTTTLVLVCDPAVDAQVDARLFDSFGGTLLAGPVHLECGPDSLSGNRRDTVKVATSVNAGWADVSVFAVQAGAFNGGCPGGSVVPASLECPGSSHKSPAPGATLTIR